MLRVRFTMVLKEVPETHDNQSFLLQAGERLIKRDQNKLLGQFLKVQEQNGFQGGQTTINAPLSIQRVNNDDEIMSVVSKYPKQIAALNQKGGKFRPNQRRG